VPPAAKNQTNFCLLALRIRLTLPAEEFIVREGHTPQEEQLQPPVQLPEQQSLQSQPAIVYEGLVVMVMSIVSWIGMLFEMVNDERFDRAAILSRGA